MSEIDRETAERMAEVVTTAMTGANLLSAMMTPEDAALLRKAADEYEESTRGKRVLADLFGRSAINQQDANALAKLPVLRAMADLIEKVHEMPGKATLHVHGEEFWEDFIG